MSVTKERVQGWCYLSKSPCMWCKPYLRWVLHLLVLNSLINQGYVNGDPIHYYLHNPFLLKTFQATNDHSDNKQRNDPYVSSLWSTKE